MPRAESSRSRRASGGRTPGLPPRGGPRSETSSRSGIAGHRHPGVETTAVRGSLRAFAELGRALIGARDTGEALDAVITDGPGWEGLGDLVAKAAALTNTVVSDPLNHVSGGLQPLPPLHAAAAAGLLRGRGAEAG